MTKAVLLRLLTVLGSMFATLATSSAFADLTACMQDIYTAGGGSGQLGCTSNDVRIAKVTNVTPISGFVKNQNGSFQQPLTCYKDTQITFKADFRVELGATGGARYDIGLYIANGQASALKGTCNTGVINDSNSAMFRQKDAAPDACGDIEGPLNGHYNPQIVNLEINTTCKAGLDDKLLLPNCTSWRQPGSNGVCTTIGDAFPGSPSKCNCDAGFTVSDIDVEPPALDVAKSANPTSVPEGAAGGEVTFTVTVKNPLVASTIVLTELKDDFTSDGTFDVFYSSSTSPTLASICGKVTLDPGEQTTCSFKRTISGLEAGKSQTDNACVTGTLSPSGASISNCDTAEVKAYDVLPAATVTKTFEGACSILTYKAKVANDDKAEALKLTALVDLKVGGDGVLTSIHHDLVGTTCGVATGAKGLGTLEGLSGAGLLPFEIPINGNYSCTFEVLRCGNGIINNTATATLNDGEDNVINASGNVSVTISIGVTPP